jgi:3-hydroxy-3-methylglutaryl CoA synthase
VNGLVAYGTYLPYWRLERGAIAASLGTPPGRGTRAVASYDEDTTTMGVEAARVALAAAPEGVEVGQVLFASSNPAYLDKTNATAIHAALGLDPSVGAYDMGGSVRSAIGANRAAIAAPVPTLVIRADLRTGLAGGADERDGGDGADAYLFAPRDAAGNAVIAELLGAAASTAEFLDRWRLPGDTTSRVWEERFGEHAYVPLAEAALTEALKRARLTADAIDHLVVTGVHPRAARVVTKSVGVRPEAVVDDLSSQIGNPGAAQRGIVLADVLDRAQPGQVVAVVSLADGADVGIVRTTDALAEYHGRRRTTVAEQLAGGRRDLTYPTFLTWRGQLHLPPSGTSTGSSASPPAGASSAAPGTCRPPASAAPVVPSTAWPTSAWPTPAPPSPRSPSTGWLTRSTRRWSPRWSTSTAAAASAASSPTSTRPRWRSAAGWR